MKLLFRSFRWYVAYALIIWVISIGVYMVVREAWHISSVQEGMFAVSASVDSDPLTHSTVPTKAFVNGEYPARLVIPTLDIDAPVQHVGLTKAGAMGIPSNYRDVAWYKYGTIPGKKGSAVIDGHVDNALSLPGVFSNLKDIRAGDDIYVTRHDGSRIHFQVTGVRSYDYKDVPVETIFNEKNAAYLNLITCSGDWVGADKTYDTRLVVSAVLKK